MHRVTTVVDGESSVLSPNFDLVVLDVSMNIAKGSLGPMRGGHANLGGLAIAERMFLEGVEKPTLILTGFDHFQRLGLRHSNTSIISLLEVEEAARRLLGSNLLGCIRYGGDDWEKRFIRCLGGEAP